MANEKHSKDDERYSVKVSEKKDRAKGKGKSGAT